MTRAYIRLDPQFDERKESYPDGPYAALIATFCLAEAQPERGRFRSLDYLRRLLSKRGRHVPYLIDHGDITVRADGRVYVQGWDEWQEGDWKVNERVARIRSRRRNDDDNDEGNGLSNGRAVAPPRPPLSDSGAVPSGAKQGGAVLDAPDPVETYHLLTARVPKKAAMDWLERLADEHGAERLSQTMGHVWMEKADPSTFLSDVEADLVLSARKGHREAEDSRRRADGEAERQEQERIAAMTPAERAASVQRFRETVAPLFGGIVKDMP